MLGPNNLCSNNLCYQLMPYMSDSLNEVMRRSGCLKVLSERERPADWRRVDENMWFCVLIPVLQGLEHLESLNMQHCDVKGEGVHCSGCDYGISGCGYGISGCGYIVGGG